MIVWPVSSLAPSEQSHRYAWAVLSTLWERWRNVPRDFAITSRASWEVFVNIEGAAFLSDAFGEIDQRAFRRMIMGLLGPGFESGNRRRIYHLAILFVLQDIQESVCHPDSAEEVIVHQNLPMFQR